ncbi:MAG: sugar ABC transporter permease [Firmicutes bacterium]|nr:sugar ABC transporter permease [Bacillota bacterium]MCL5040626.1 sugar ABC transporter permease [Bacillota bacterium]
MKKRSGGNSPGRGAVLFVIPALAIYTLFLVYPIVSALAYSLFQWNGFLRQSFSGFANFRRLLLVEPFSSYFINALKHNGLYFLLSLVAQNGLGLALALMINTRLKGAGFFKTALFLPRLLSVVVVGFLWSLLLNPSFGVVNQILRAIGLEALARPWLGDTQTALVMIILVNAWFAVGFAMLVYLAGLQSIPDEYLEAARLDGANSLQLFWRVILPLLRPSLTIMLVLTFIHSFEAFDLVFAMEGSAGGPYYSTDTLATFFYRLAFGGASGTELTDIGLGSALATVMFLIIFGVSSLSVSFLRRREVQF